MLKFIRLLLSVGYWNQYVSVPKWSHKAASAVDAHGAVGWGVWHKTVPAQGKLLKKMLIGKNAKKYPKQCTPSLIFCLKAMTSFPAPWFSTMCIYGTFANPFIQLWISVELRLIEAITFNGRFFLKCLFSLSVLQNQLTKLNFLQNVCLSTKSDKFYCIF